MIDLSKRQLHLDSPLRLNGEFRGDLHWRASFLEVCNGVSLVVALCRRPIDARLISDASGSWGCGAFSEMVQPLLGNLPYMERSTHKCKGGASIVIASAIWSREMAGSHVCCCDNAAVVVKLISTSLLSHWQCTY